MSADELYETLAADYHLLFDDWHASMRAQGEMLHRLLGGQRLRVLDVSCGMGTQAIGLALQGHLVAGRDASPALVARAREEAKRFGLDVPFAVGDMRVPAPGDAARFDVVVSLDNALPHLSTHEELVAALAAARAALVPGGKFLASIRDYDALVESRPTFTPPRVLTRGGDERVVVQRWAWDADGAAYDFEQVLLLRREGGWSVRTYAGRYRALLRADLDAAARAAGFAALEWLEPDATGFYQPILQAR